MKELNNFSAGVIVITIILFIVGVFLLAPFLLMVLLGGLAHSLGLSRLAIGFGSSVQLSLLLGLVGMYFSASVKKSS